MRIFCDSSFLVAFRHSGDPYHLQAKQIVTERLAELQPCWLVITDYVFDETVSVLKSRASGSTAIETARRLLSREFDLQFVDEKLFNEAVDVFTRYGDKEWSFTDCTSYAWIKRFKPDYVLATDEDFEQFGLAPRNLMREAP